MPHTLNERAARRLVAALRTVTPDHHPWSDSEDAEIVGPLLARSYAAAADLLEYLIDVHGATYAAVEFRTLLHITEALLPQPLEGLPPCDGPLCDPGATSSRSWALPDFFADHYARDAIAMPHPGVPAPRAAAYATRGDDTQPLTIVA